MSCTSLRDFFLILGRNFIDSSFDFGLHVFGLAVDIRQTHNQITMLFVEIKMKRNERETSDRKNETK